MRLIGKERHLITVYPDMKFGEPCVDHHRIPAEMMARVWWNGEFTVEGIERHWPGMNRGAVLVACWYQARYGTRLWGKRWKEWLTVAAGELWAGQYDSCPMPPTHLDSE